MPTPPRNRPWAVSSPCPPSAGTRLCLGVCPPRHSRPHLPGDGDNHGPTALGGGRGGGVGQTPQGRKSIPLAQAPCQHPLPAAQRDPRLPPRRERCRAVSERASCFGLSRRCEPRARVPQHRWLHRRLSRRSHLFRRCRAVPCRARVPPPRRGGKARQTKPAGPAAAGRSQGFYLCERPVDKHKKKEPPRVPCWF